MGRTIRDIENDLRRAGDRRDWDSCDRLDAELEEAKSRLKADESRAPRLHRFKADPETVRVSVRRVGDHWLATVAGRGEPSRQFTKASKKAEEAVDGALRRAARAELEGVDLECGWIYEHPHGAPGVAARVPER